MPTSADASARTGYEVAIVGYRSRPHIEALSELLAGLPMIVIDNSGDSDGVKAVIEARPDGRYLDGGGVGFAKAANLGARTSDAEYVVFVNPDSRPTRDQLDRLVATLQDDPMAVSCAATMVGADGHVEIGNGGWEPSLRRAAVHAAGLHKLLPTAGLFATPRPYLPLDVDWTTGACMAVRRKAFLDLGGFDESFYVYNEDMAFGRTARQQGLRQKLRTDVLVAHSAGGSGAPSLEMMQLRGASMAGYVDRYRPAAEATAVRAVLAAGYAGRALACLARGNRRRADEHLAYVRGAISGTATVAGRRVSTGD